MQADMEKRKKDKVVASSSETISTGGTEGNSDASPTSGRMKKNSG